VPDIVNPAEFFQRFVDAVTSHEFRAKVGTVWAVLDDLETPTEITAVYVAADVSEGAAVWLEIPQGITADDFTAALDELVAATR